MCSSGRSSEFFCNHILHDVYSEGAANELYRACRFNASVYCTNDCLLFGTRTHRAASYSCIPASDGCWVIPVLRLSDAFQGVSSFKVRNSSSTCASISSTGTTLSPKGYIRVKSGVVSMMTMPYRVVPSSTVIAQALLSL